MNRPVPEAAIVTVRSRAQSEFEAIQLTQALCLDILEFRQRLPFGFIAGGGMWKHRTGEVEKFSCYTTHGDDAEVGHLGDWLVRDGRRGEWRVYSEAAFAARFGVAI